MCKNVSVFQMCQMCQVCQNLSNVSKTRGHWYTSCINNGQFTPFYGVAVIGIGKYTYIAH